jgi:exodeoxyribonuclease V gamma subunit
VSGFYLYHGNDQEKLLDTLAAALVAVPLADPMQPERFIVQSQGMRRWVSLRLASRLGILAHIAFRFPNEFLWETFETVLPDGATKNRLDRETLTWRIFGVLPVCLNEPAFKPLHGYLSSEGAIDALKHYQLSLRIAHVFDQYCMYRPELIAGWDAGQEFDWQPELWRRSMLDSDLIVPRLRRDFHRFLPAAADAGKIPERVLVFGITSLPPLHIEILKALSQYSDVHLFFLNPTPAYWADILPEKEIARRLSFQTDPTLTEQELFLEEGNSLIASMGRTGRDFFRLLTAADMIEPSTVDAYSVPAGDSLLQRVQAHIFHLGDERLIGPKEAVTDDESLQIHACHSRLREVEILHDQLLRIFEREPTLKPDDVLVMAPDISVYVPFIRSVFDPGADRDTAFPFAVADGDTDDDGQVIPWFLKLLMLPDSRFGRSAIVALLESPAILATFNLKPPDVELIQNWIEKTGIRWGIDDLHRERFIQPAVDENTWRFGIERLLLGLALHDNGTPFNAILPFDGIEGQTTAVLNGFLRFFQRLVALVRPEALATLPPSEPMPPVLDLARSLSDWADCLQAVLRAFCRTAPDWENELQTLLDAFRFLKELETRSGFRGPVALNVIRQVLEKRLAQRSRSERFPGAGLTFCSLLPMRSIPYAVIALLGVNDQEFPRADRPLQFNRMATDPKVGDRSLTDDDRYLFLESLISARRILYISYIGQSIVDNRPLPPSPLISELLHYLDQQFPTGDGSWSERLITRHFLQAFNPGYFGRDPKKVSYSTENLAAATVMERKRPVSLTPLVTKLSDPMPEWRSVSLEQLTDFFRHPARFLVQKRLEINLEEPPDVVGESEPFELDRLQQYQLKSELVESFLEGRPAAEIEQKAVAAGLLPPRAVGRYHFRPLIESASALENTLRPLLDSQPEAPLRFDFRLGDFLIRGTLDRIRSNGLIHYRAARINLRDRMRHWLETLVYHFIAQSDDPPPAFLVGFDPKDHPVVLQTSPSDAAEHLATLLHFYWQGLSSPLPFFPRTSLRYAETLLDKTPDEAMKAARNTWRRHDGSGEHTDPWLARCFPQDDPLDQDFVATTEAILLPIFEHQKPR